jgi:GMP synthase (glutamine-hydrolysing)
MKKILIVEGNLKEENQSFSLAGIQTHTESLKDSLAYFTDKLETHVVNPSSDENIDKNIDALESYDGLIWGGSSLNIYNNTPEIKRQIEFMKECQKKINKILAICWGMQVAVVAAGGEVKKSSNGSHIGIAFDIELNPNGQRHPIYKGKKNKFCSPAFNFDEVVTLPKDATLLASNNINKISSISFNHEKSEIWGIQYHPEIKYEKMIELIKFRKDRLINHRKAFKSYDEIDHHISLIKNELSKSEINHRMIELKNWLGSINGN